MRVEQLSTSYGPITQAEMGISADLPAAWLRNLGFRSDPFLYLEASGDPFLGKYLVGHEMFAIAWDSAPACIFAPAGGGKTAMRIYTARSCWVGFGGSHPFPIPYILPHHIRLGQRPVSDGHLRELVEAGALALLLSVVFRPEHLLATDAASQQAVSTFLSRSLPRPLGWYIDVLREGGPRALPPLLDRSYVLPDEPSKELLRELCCSLERTALASSTLPSYGEKWEQLVGLLLGPLGFRSIYVLIDGVDATAETIDNPEMAVDWIAWLIAQISPWAAQRTYLKFFLPLEIEDELARRFSDILTAVRCARLEWTPTLLAEVIRRRVSVASEDEFSSLDAISSPALRDVEMMLVKQILQLPREALFVVRRALIACARRTAGTAGQLELEDVRAALDWYQSHRVRRHIGHVLE